MAKKATDRGSLVAPFTGAVHMGQSNPIYSSVQVSVRSNLALSLEGTGIEKTQETRTWSLLGAYFPASVHHQDLPSVLIPYFPEHEGDGTESSSGLLSWPCIDGGISQDFDGWSTRSPAYSSYPEGLCTYVSL